jgi:hypothetical protein
LASVPTMSTANAMKRTLSSFMGSVSAGWPTNTIGRTASSGGIGRTASRTRLAERLVQAAAPGDDSQPGPSLIAVSLSQYPDEHRPERPVLLAVDPPLASGVPVHIHSRTLAQVLMNAGHADCVEFMG